MRSAAILLMSVLALPCVASARGGSGDRITVAVVGDVMPGHRALEFMARYGPGYFFEKTRAIISSADIAFCNLEAPVTSSGAPCQEKDYIFKAPPEAARGLAYAGFDIVSLANNHSLDMGEEGLYETMEHLREHGIKWVGAGRNMKEARSAKFIDVKGRRVAFLAYSNTLPKSFYAAHNRGGTAFGRTDFVKSDVKKAKGESDFVVVSFHWGRELETTPADYQLELAHLSVESGADLVIGHHSHLIQGLELYKGGLIAYSLGNFVFGSYSRNVRFGLILVASFGDGGIESAELIPIYVHTPETLFCPFILTGRRGLEVLEEVRSLSRDFNTSIHIDHKACIGKVELHAGHKPQSEPEGPEK